jgi:hypothetical protein
MIYECPADTGDGGPSITEHGERKGGGENTNGGMKIKIFKYVF